MRILIVSQKVGEGYGQERIVASSTAALRQAGHLVEWVAESCEGEVTATAFHQIRDLFHLNSLTPKATAERALESLLQVAGSHTKDSSTLIHFVDHLDGRLFTGASKRFPTLFTAHTAAPTCPASGRVVEGLPVCPQQSGWSCLVHHYRYHCLSAQRTPAHRAHAVFEFQKRHAALHSVTRILSVSHFLEEQLLRDGYLRKQVAYVPNPVEASEEKDGDPKIDPPAGPLLVTAARLVPMKGISHLIEALKAIEDDEWTLWIVGEGPERERLGALTEKLELSSRIKFLGKKTRSETAAIFRAATLVVQPNVGPEGFGLSVAEASLLGRPVIAYDVPGLNEVIEHEKTGLLVKYGDKSALWMAISRVLENPDWGRDLGAAGTMRIVANYSRETHLVETMKQYELALKEKG